jgi:hypothetical protein
MNTNENANTNVNANENETENENENEHENENALKPAGNSSAEPTSDSAISPSSAPKTRFAS